MAGIMQRFLGAIKAEKVIFSAAAPAAAGTNRATATQLTAMFNDLTVVGSGQGVILPEAKAGGLCLLVNRVTSSGNAVKVYGKGSDTVDTQVAATGVTLTDATGAFCWFVCFVDGAWVSSTGASVIAT